MSNAKKISWLAGLTAIIVAPQVVGIVHTNVLVEMAIFALFAASLNMLLSFTGLLSFGHALYYGTGAYACALALTHMENMPLIPAILIGGLAPAAAALILSPLLVRVKDTAFAMLTMAFGNLMFIICLKFREVTGGEDGLASYTVPPLNLGFVSWDLSDTATMFYFVVAAAALCLFGIWAFTKTPMGSVMVGIRDNQQKVDYLGYRVPHIKAVIFIISGFMAGIAGALFCIFNEVVSTDGVITPMVSFYPLMAILVGGMGTFVGPILGAVILVLLEEVVMTFTDRFELVSGLIFIFMVMFMPGGAAWIGTVLRLAAADKKHKSAGQTETQTAEGA